MAHTSQDSWQIKRNLTMNYGLRYDIEDGAFKGGTIQDSRVPGGCLQANGLIPACSSDKNNWQPRIGFAYGPQFEHGIGHFLFGAPGKTVIRAARAEVTELAYLNVVLDSLNFDAKKPSDRHLSPHQRVVLIHPVLLFPLRVRAILKDARS